MAKQAFKIGDIVQYTTSYTHSPNTTRVGKIIDTHDNGNRGTSYLVEYERKEGDGSTFNSRQWISPRYYVPAETIGIYTSRPHWNGYKMKRIK